MSGNYKYTGLRKFVAPEFVFGNGAIDLTPNYINNLGAGKVLLITDIKIMELPWYKKIKKSLTDLNIKHSLFTQITPNPRDFESIAGAEIFLSTGCDTIVALGGGSVLDCAKGIGILVSNGGKINDYEGVDRIYEPIPPLICIPTTAGTSADVSQFAIILDPEEKIKRAIISKTIVPDVSLIDPQTLTSMDSYLTACTGIDALVHAIEAFVSNASSPITDIHALNAIRLINDYLIKSIKNPENLTFRTAVMQGSLEAGLAFSNASLGAVHAMAHSLGGLLDLPHGECNAILLDHVISYNYESAPERYTEICKIIKLPVGGLTNNEIKKTLTGHIDNLKKEAGIRKTLSDNGLKKTDIQALAQNSMKDPCIVTNPRKPALRDIEVIYEEAL